MEIVARLGQDRNPALDGDADADPSMAADDASSTVSARTGGGAKDDDDDDETVLRLRHQNQDTDEREALLAEASSAHQLFASLQLAPAPQQHPSQRLGAPSPMLHPHPALVAQSSPPRFVASASAAPRPSPAASRLSPKRRASSQTLDAQRSSNSSGTNSSDATEQLGGSSSEDPAPRCKRVRLKRRDASSMSASWQPDEHAANLQLLHTLQTKLRRVHTGSPWRAEPPSK